MIGIVGINFKSAPLSVREKISFSDEEALKFIKQLKIDKNLLGAIVLSTCNRTEIYFDYNKTDCSDGFEIVLRNLTYFKNYDSDIKNHFYFKQGHEVTDHLFRVVSGIDSLVIGEDQIINQVKQAFKLSLDNDISSSILTRLFNKAFEAGKRVRTETTIKRGATSVSSAAVELCVSKYQSLKDKNIMLLGAGQTGELALISLTKKGYKSINITNRTFSKAQDLARKYNAIAFEISQLSDYLSKCDIVIVATSSKTHLIKKDIAEEALKIRSAGQLFIDLSVPRNISEDVGKIDGIELYAVDDLKEIVNATIEKKKEVISEAIEIIEIVKQEFNEWLDSLELTPIILKIKNNFHKINSSELEGFIKKRSVQDSELIATYAQHITEKYARLFIKNLKSLTENGKKKEVVDFVGELFELS